MSIVKKMVIGYFAIIFFPILIAGYLLYQQLYDDILVELSNERQQVFQQSLKHLELEMIKIESLYNSLQFNSNITDYLQGFYSNDRDSVYHYMKNIKPLFSLIHTESPYIERLSIYSSNSNIHFVYPYINNLDLLQLEENRISIPPGKGRWILEEQNGEGPPSLKYYQSLYNSMYTDVIGVMEVVVSDNLLEYVINITEKDNHLVMRRGNEIIYNRFDEIQYNYSLDNIIEGLDYGETSSGYMKEHDIINNSLFFDSLDVQFVIIEGTELIFSNHKDKRNFLIGTTILFLLILSLIYYFLAYSLTQRVLNLANYMRTIDGNNLKPYTGKIKDDEIGRLTSSYNLMIKRIDDLVNRVQREELMRKEAEYLALQSQMNPHFIYNTLETIRMLAEINGDEDVSEISWYFGKLIRYSLSSKSSQASLKEEIEHVRDYLKIHEIRMGERFSFEIKIKTEIDTFSCPRFILQPLVENCISHGVSQKRSHGTVEIIIKETHKYMIVIIKDNGMGMSKERLSQIRFMFKNSVKPEELYNSIALYNVSERIKLFYGNDSSISIYSKYKHGTAYVLQLEKRR